MRAFTVLTVGVSLVFGLQATDNKSVAEYDTQYAAGRSAAERQNYSAAIGLFEQCVRLAGDHAERANALASYGIALHRVDRNTEARPALEQALVESGNVSAAWPPRLATSGALAAVYRSLGDYQGSERVMRATISDPSASSMDRAALMVNLADLLREESRGAEAGAVLDEAGRLPGLSWQRQADVLVEMAELDREMHKLDASIALWNEIGEIQSSQNSTRYDGIIAGGLGETWFWAGNLARAEPLLRRSVQLLRIDPAASTPQLATALAVLAHLYLIEDKLAVAGEAMDEAIAKDEAMLGPEHPQIAALLEVRAEILSRRGEPQAARDELELARIIMSSHFGPESSAVAGVLSAMGDVELRASQPAAAALQYGEATRLFREAGPDDEKYGAAIVPRYAAALKAAHRPDEARALLRTFRAQAKSGSAAPAIAQSFRGK